jgi:subtilisin family serine protease
LWDLIRPENLWHNRTGKGIRVAIIDSGIDINHPALQGKVAESVEAVTEGGRIVFRPSISGDVAGHGIPCAGIISSISPDASIYSVKVLG